MKTQRTPAEVKQIDMLIRSEDSFINCFRHDWTKNVIEDLRNRLYGRIPRNFLLNIKGLVGTPTGIFKSTMGLQLAFLLDPFFNIRQRVAFSVNEILDKIRNYTEYSFCNRCLMEFQKTYRGTYELDNINQDIKCDNCDNLSDKRVLLTKLIFFLDEQSKTLKMGGLMRLANIVDTARQRQICFITCGVEAYDFNFTTYELRRIQESNDNYLPKKIVRYGVYDPERNFYYGYFKWNITPLTNKMWLSIWKEYSAMKTDFQRVAMSGQIQQMDFESYAEEVMQNKDFPKCFRLTGTGKRVFQTSIAKALIFKEYPDMTRDEREMILSNMKMILQENNEEDDLDN